METVWKLARGYAEPRSLGRKDFDILRWEDASNVERFLEDRPDILVHRSLISFQDVSLFSKHFPEGATRPRVYAVAYAKVAVIVHPSNPIKAAILDQIKQLLQVEGSGLRWNQLGSTTNAVIHCYGEKRDAPSRLVIRHNCMMLGPEYPTGYHLYRDDFAQCADNTEVVKKVQQDVNGIGFILYQGQPLQGVKLLPIGTTEQGPFIAPKQGPFIQKDYPLSEPMVLYLHPDAPTMAKELCEFAVGPQGSEILAKLGFITPLMDSEASKAERLVDFKAGKGRRVPVVSMASTHPLMLAAGEAFVRQQALLQLSCVASSGDSEALAAFVSSAGSTRELLMLEDRPSERALRANEKQWNDLNPEERLLAGRAVAIVTNPANKLDSLTLDQVRAIFSGEVREWNLLAAGTGVIRCLGLPGNDPNGQVFYKEVLPFERLGAVTAKKDTAEVLKAVSMDANAIGFVDWSALPEKGQTVKMLAIGPKGKAVAPTREAIRTAMYPISSRMYLYVHPKASDTAKDFAAFLTSAACSETFRRYNLIPLSDAALVAKPTTQPKPSDTAKKDE